MVEGVTGIIVFSWGVGESAARPTGQAAFATNAAGTLLVTAISWTTNRDGSDAVSVFL
jgi:hypothetical protein